MDNQKKLSGLSPSMMFMDELSELQPAEVNNLIQENINLKSQNLQLRRANSRLKNRGRRLTRIIIAYKLKIKELNKQKPKFRNKNHQGRKR